MARKAQKYIIDVVPLTRIPMDKGPSFSYLYEKKITKGTLVSIPLFRRTLPGIVLESRTDFHRLGNIQLKKIESIIEENFLDKKQLELAKFLSEYYVSSLGIILKSFVPKRIKERKLKEKNIDKKISKNKIVLTKDQQFAINTIVKKHSKFKIQNSKFLLYGPSASGKTEVYIHSILEIQKESPQKQFLILLPELTLTPQALERYSAHFNPEEIALLSSNLSKGRFYSHWQNIKTGQAKIIIGTRMAVFAPFQNLGLIIIDEEQDASFKQWDMNPRYDARKAGEKLSEIHSCPIVFGSATPRAEDYYHATRKNLLLLKLPRLEDKKIPTAKYQTPDTVLVDMKKERWEKRYSPISKKLESEIHFALKNQKQVILFVNRRGMSSFSVCEKCKTVLKCPKCDRALTYSKDGSYHCLHCSFQTSIFPKCSKCQGMEFKNLGTGTEKVEKEIEKLFPGAKILRFDSGRKHSEISPEEVYQKFRDHEADILIGTEMIGKNWDLPDLSLVGIIEGDSLFTLPDYWTDEKGLSTLLQLKGRMSRPLSRFPGLFLLQTFRPENKLWKILENNDWESFCQKQLEQREVLKLPPFSRIVKLIFRDSDEEKSKKETSRVFSEIIKKDLKGIQILPPQKAFLDKIRGRFRRQIIIKILKNGPWEELEKILRKLPTGWIIDIDPISLT